MKENNENNHSLIENDSFLNRIRGQIRLLGFAAISSLIFIGTIAVLTLWRSSMNKTILNQMNIITSNQYEINNMDESYYSSEKSFSNIESKFKSMRDAAENALDNVYTASTENDIQNLKRDIARLTTNYEKLLTIGSTRGYSTAHGLYKEYAVNDTLLYSEISSLSADLSDYFQIADYLEILYGQTSHLSDYTSGVLEGKVDSSASWQIYGSLRTLQQRIETDVDTMSHDARWNGSNYKNRMKALLPMIDTSRILITKMISLDKEFITVHNNNKKLFEHLLSTTDRIRNTEESNSSTEQNLMLMLMIFMIIILVSYLTVHTLLLRRDMSRSISVFNELLVAKAANDAQSSFLSTVSHEIRTPINAIMGMNEIIIRESNNKQIEHYALEIKDSSRTLLSLVNDLLDSSRLDADRLKIIPVEYDLSSAISDLANMISSRVKEKNLNFFINVNEELPHMLFGDEIRIKQCVLNLLTNAVKYTESGSITLNVDFEIVNRGSIILRFQVIDTGIGMKEEDLAHLFERFSRFDEKKNRNIEGTGLGMNIVNRLLALMGTNLEVRSIYGRGSDFSFGVHQGVINWAPIGDYNSMYEKSIRSEKKYHEKLRAPAARVLIVDDMQVNLTVFKGLLKKTEIQIDAALSGKTAIEMIKKNSYDIVFLDHRMPKMDGIETLINIRELNNNPNHSIPYIALTANAISGARELYINAGFTDYLSKPIDSTELENLLIEYLPKELVELRSEREDGSWDDESDTATVDDTTTPNTDSAESDEKMHELLQNLEGIDYSLAIENCVEDETLIEALNDFLQSLETKPAEIERYWLDKDYRNYTVQVHALKSTARLIGATKLADDAYYLEQCGDAENETAIDEKTDALLDLFESYQAKLQPFVDLQKANESNASGEEIPEEMFLDALNSVKELVDSFDFGNAEEVLKMLKNYKLSCEQQAKYDTMYKMVRNVDRDAVLEWFTNTLQ
ncbi:MAG: ATP-binding protein [Eubacterium sp.]|nr:ATP-binding protein [Eubacterium sp.]